MSLAASLVAARVLHVLGVVIWIGGVAFVTTIVLPTVRRLPSAHEQIERFESIEGPFAPQARIATLVTGLSGFYMLHHLIYLGPLSRPVVLVGSPHDAGLAGLYTGAVRVRAAVSASLVS